MGGEEIKKQAVRITTLSGQRVDMLKNMRGMNARLEKVERECATQGDLTAVTQAVCSVIGVQEGFAKQLTLTGATSVMLDANAAYRVAHEAGMRKMMKDAENKKIVLRRSSRSSRIEDVKANGKKAEEKKRLLA